MAVHKSSTVIALILAFSVTTSVAARTPAAVLFSHKLAEEPKKPVTFVFGDSLTDNGNNNYLPLSIAKSDYPWYGVDYPQGPTGRFTNGKTIGDFLSEKLGIEPPPPYLSLFMNDDAILHGANYASGGAGILKETGFYFMQKLSFDDQISCFEKTKAAITAKIGEVASEKLCNEAIYFIGLGSNDYVNNFLRPLLPDGLIYSPDEFIDLLVSALDRQLRRLYALGARRVVFHGVGPLGCIPSQRAKSLGGECLTSVNEYVQQFNYRVAQLMESLDSKLPGAQFAFGDSYHIVLDMIEHPYLYGFGFSNTSCCKVDTAVGGLCLPNAWLCSNRREFVFWDDYHPSEAANEVIAEHLFADPSLSHAPSPPPPAAKHK